MESDADSSFAVKGVGVARELSARLERLGWALLLIVLAALSLVLFILTVVSLALIVVVVGLPLLAACIPAVRGLAGVHRRIAGRLLGVTVAAPYLRGDDRRRIERPLVIVRDRATWRDLAWLFANCTVGLALSIGAVLESILDLLFWWLPRSILLLMDAHLMRLLLSPRTDTRLAERVQQLTESRAETVDTQAAELRRIERDLHDGAQARLVALGMSLGLAAELVEEDPGQARQLLAEARSTNSQALAELRDLVRGIHPPVLADRGLVGAVQALVLATPLPVELTADVPGRLPPPVESAAYFAVAEALTNVIKHSSAASASIELRVDGQRLHLRVTDDGVGGAAFGQGTGLRGIQRRLAAFDGTLTLASPAGGPTTVEMELPCVSY